MTSTWCVSDECSLRWVCAGLRAYKNWIEIRCGARHPCTNRIRVYAKEQRWRQRTNSATSPNDWLKWEWRLHMYADRAHVCLCVCENKTKQMFVFVRIFFCRFHSSFTSCISHFLKLHKIVPNWTICKFFFFGWSVWIACAAFVVVQLRFHLSGMCESSIILNNGQTLRITNKQAGKHKIVSAAGSLWISMLSCFFLFSRSSSLHSSASPECAHSILNCTQAMCCIFFFLLLENQIKGKNLTISGLGLGVQRP